MSQMNESRERMLQEQRGGNSRATWREFKSNVARIRSFDYIKKSINESREGNLKKRPYIAGIRSFDHSMYVCMYVT